jgi:hypothetical protein
MRLDQVRGCIVTRSRGKPGRIETETLLRGTAGTEQKRRSPSSCSGFEASAASVGKLINRLSVLSLNFVMYNRQ